MTKGADTRQRILDNAFRLAARDGLGGVSLGTLADDIGLSKSGLFAHFRSKEELQLEMLRTASMQFVENVMVPALRKPRGVPRLRAMFDNWLAWASTQQGGCIFVTASVELDDRPGRVRDYVAQQQQALMDAIARAAEISKTEGHFRKDLDVEQFAFEMEAIYLVFHHAHRLLRDPKAAKRARAAFNRLIQTAAAPV
ncbi:MAG: TetR/AcrR family transcriptional regulator [Myxococcales bacterium]|nr:TetR/AcrR family transcriptional regulator [Myxococcales bacterium]